MFRWKNQRKTRKMKENKQEKLETEKEIADLNIKIQNLKVELKNALMTLALEKQQSGRIIQAWSMEIK